MISNRDFRDFAHVVAHELKTPLWVVRYFCEALNEQSRDRLDDEDARFLDESLKSLDQMVRLMDDLLKYAEVGGENRPFEPVNSNEALNAALASFSGELKSAGGAVTRDELPVVQSDRTMLVQLFQNLLGNAIKYRRQDQLPQIHVSAARTGGWWEFSVRDNGIGIAPEDAGRIFGIFERVDKYGSAAGTGIGLAICKRFVEMHGGEIRVESEPDRGSTFYFSLAAAHSA